jgi:hypothetical protein
MYRRRFARLGSKRQIITGKPRKGKLSVKESENQISQFNCPRAENDQDAYLAVLKLMVQNQPAFPGMRYVIRQYVSKTLAVQQINQEKANKSL